MTATIYTIASGKGGTGKTTTTVNLGAALAGLGKKTLILDADIGMANLGLLLGLEKSEVTLHEVLAETANIEDATYEGVNGLKVVPSGISLKGFQNANPEKLHDIMDGLVEKFDFTLIDAPAGISKDGVVPLAIADEVLLVVNPDISSIADALKTKILVEMLDNTVTGAVLNKVGNVTTEFSKEKVEKLLEVPILATVPEDVRVRHAAASKTPVVVKNPGSPTAIAFKRLAASLAGEEIPDEPVVEEKKVGFVGKFARTIFGGRQLENTG
jgi:septum site-determining protein MinD